jgi:hypothetical protein
MAVPNFLNLTNLSLNNVHTFVGGSSGTGVTLNDSDIRGITYTHPEFNGGGLNTTSGTTISIGQLRGASNIQVSAGVMPLNFPNNRWGDEDVTTTNTSFPQSLCRMKVTLQTASNRVKFEATSGNSIDGFETVTQYVTYTNCEGNSVDFQIKCTSNAVIDPLSPSNTTITGTFNSYLSMTNNTTILFEWNAQATSSSTFAKITSSANIVFSFRVRFTVSGDYLYFPTSTTALETAGRALFLRANYSFGGGGGGGGGGPV